MWSILSAVSAADCYGVTPPGFTTMINRSGSSPVALRRVRFDGHGGSSGVTFGFDKNEDDFPDSLIDEWRMSI